MGIFETFTVGCIWLFGVGSISMVLGNTENTLSLIVFRVIPCLIGITTLWYLDNPGTVLGAIVIAGAIYILAIALMITPTRPQSASKQLYALLILKLIPATLSIGTIFYLINYG